MLYTYFRFYGLFPNLDLKESHPIKTVFAIKTKNENYLHHHLQHIALSAQISLTLSLATPPYRLLLSADLQEYNLIYY